MANGIKPAPLPASFPQGDWLISERGGLPEWEAVLRSAKRRLYPARHTIFREGEVVDGVLVIRRGLVKLIAHSSDGRARIVRLQGQGAWLGLGGLFDPIHEHTAVAMGEVEADGVALGAIIRLRKDDPESYCRLLESWCAYFRRADLWITEFSTGPIRARVARLVDFLSALQHDAPSTEVELLTCEDMAGILGVTVESVSRTLAEFKRNKLLRAVPCHPAKLYEWDAVGLRVMAVGESLPVRRGTRP
ncbi:Crp/Fnr family transcriptional regulator [Methylomagnum sp.]